MVRTEYCNDDHCCADCDNRDHAGDLADQVGNKVDIMRSFFKSMLGWEGNQLTELCVCEREPTCAWCRSVIQDGVEDFYRMPAGFAGDVEDHSLLVDGKLPSNVESAFLQVDYGNGWKFDIKISKSFQSSFQS